MKFTTVFRATGDVGGALLLCVGLGLVVGFGPLSGVPIIACIGLPLAVLGFGVYALGVMTVADWDARPGRQLAGAICNVIGLLVAFGALVWALGYCHEELLRLSRSNQLDWRTGVRRVNGELTNAYRDIPPKPGQRTGIGPAPWYWAGGIIVSSALLWGVLVGLLWLGTPRRPE